MKICVADDEQKIRESIISKIKADIPYAHVFDAGFGREALQNIVLVRPDLVFIDIRMPELDGLEILQQLKQTGHLFRVVIVTGFSDFEYTQRALRLGAMDYLLKPVNRTQLQNIVRNVHSDIKARLHHDLCSLLERSGDAVLKVRVHDNASIWFDDRQAKQVQFMRSGKNTDSSIFEEGMEAIANYELADGNSLQVVKASGHGALPVFWASGEFLKAYAAARVLHEEEQFFGVTGMVSRKLDRIPQETQDQLELLLAALSVGDAEAADSLLKHWFGQLEHLTLPLLRSECARFAEQAFGGQSEFHAGTEEALRFRVEAYGTWFELRLGLSGKIQEELAERRNQKERCLDNVGWLERLLRLLEQSEEPGLTLESAAAYAGVHPVTLSRMFKQHTGRPFVQQLISYRMRIARDMLLSGGRNISEIALLVGYADTRHFSRLFKKEFGLTPGAYREARQIRQG
ncbi:response regulator [Paenibacillus sp. S150]|uniref:response regulator transcription factor n=1 Tax=Paenibacillus sp. S150 TaxID=2749826 RepID=UPI001C56757D|nr:response regulator [Paenibacillus sp. S150]MBW4081004.1 response regulator [Paenibacillus sp. S150]